MILGNIKWVLSALQGWNVSMNGMHAMAAALNWDGRLRPFVQELVQERVLNVQVKFA